MSAGGDAHADAREETTGTMSFANKVAFAIGSGRCGTLFLHEVMGREPSVMSSHERNPDNETFHRYCKWHRLPVDDAGFLATKEHEIRADLDQRAFSFEASPYLSLSVRELHERFGARFVFLIRRPDGVVTSFAQKGFYLNPYAVDDINLATGYQQDSGGKFFMFFARISPRGEFFRTWNAMTQVGKVAWFWKAYNERALEALETLPKDAYRLVRIEDFDHAKHVETCRFMGVDAKVSATEFDALRDSKPHANWEKRYVDQWSAQEAHEFEEQVAGLADRFGYRYRIADLVDEARAERAESQRLGRITSAKPGPRFWRARRAAAQMLRGIATSVDVS